MDFRTIVDIPRGAFTIEPCEQMLFVGSCFADSIGQRFRQEKFRATVNPFGVMYNPASILHTVRRTDCAPRRAVLTLGTNHVYLLKATGEIVDNCLKRPSRLFEERELSIDECTGYLSQAVDELVARRADVRVIVTVSPIRYAKYGYHGSQLSKAVLMLAADRLVKAYGGRVEYFPAYEIVCDELRDYRFYADDMLHPSPRAVEYIWQRLADTYFSDATKTFLREWEPVRKGLAHRPSNPGSPEYAAFRKRLEAMTADIASRYPGFETD